MVRNWGLPDPRVTLARQLFALALTGDRHPVQTPAHVPLSATNGCQIDGVTCHIVLMTMNAHHGSFSVRILQKDNQCATRTCKGPNISNGVSRQISTDPAG